MSETPRIPYLFRILSFTVVLICLAACSVELTQTPPTPTPTPEVVIQAPTDAPTQGVIPQTGSPFNNPNLPTELIPVSWSDLHLSGKLVFIVASQKDQSNPVLKIQALDLITGELVTLFQAPENSWIYFLSVSPSSTYIVLGYSPPPVNSQPQGQALYVMPLDGSQPPHLLFNPPTPDDQYLQPTWSPDGKSVYFAHINYKTLPKDQRYPTYDLERITLPDGKPEKLADTAFWPRLSADGQRLAYVTMSAQDGTNQLVTADADGKNAHPLMTNGLPLPNIIDAPLFLPDGKSLLFSAPVPVTSLAQPWYERLFGMIVAQAHTVPSDWFRTSLTGGPADRLTHLQAPGLYASLSPDKAYIASYSTGGIFVMAPDGSGVTMILTDVGGIYGTVNWIR